MRAGTAVEDFPDASSRKARKLLVPQSTPMRAERFLPSQGRGFG
jgi:hypothetical protein